MKYTFKFSLFRKKVQMFSEGERGIVVEKEPQVVCVYGTDSNYNITIFYALFRFAILNF